MSYIILLLLTITLCKGVDLNNFKLKQVLILGRHGVRSPIETNLQTMSPKVWPKFKEDPGLLTERGTLLEGYMGSYFRQWFQKEALLPEGCPNEDNIYVYTNNVNRTRATAEAFLESAFENCDVPVHYLDIDEPDPLFDPIIHNTTEAQRNKVIEEIYMKLNNSKLNAALAELSNVLDIKNSAVCKVDSICDLGDGDVKSNKIFYNVGKQLITRGPINIGFIAIDAFIMSYFNGFPMAEVAWGQITSPQKWKLLTEISRQDQYIRGITTAEDIGGPLRKYLYTTFHNFDEKPTLMLIVGHDFNLNSVIHSMGFKLIELPNQYEPIPIGGKIVFQRWTDAENDYLKIEYVYQTWSQLREGTKLSLENPPQRVLMKQKWCPTDPNGFCAWKEFVNNL